MAFSDIKHAVKNGVQRLPGEGRALISAYRQLVLMKRIAVTKLRTYGEKGPDPETVYWIDPARIGLLTNNTLGGAHLPPEDRIFDPVADKGKVYGGNWDQSTFRFDDIDVARAIRERIQTNRRWEDTDYYVRLLKQLNDTGSAPWNMRSKADLDQRCDYLDRLIASMKENGYRRNHEVILEGEVKGLDGHPEYGAEIAVAIGRDGQYLFNDGRHRLAIARVLGIKSVPVKVTVRHQRWAEFREFMRSLATKGGAAAHPNQLYQNPIHPDLRDFSSTHGCEARFEAIRPFVAGESGDLLDIGTNLGYFCHRFEELGYSCYGVELEPPIARAADRIRIAEGKNFSVICSDLFSAAELDVLRNRKFKVILALNIFHHFLKAKADYDKFVAWLGKIDVDMMIFEPHLSSEPQMANAHANFGEQAFVDFVLRHSVLNHFRQIHRCDDGRAIYKLWR